MINILLKYSFRSPEKFTAFNDLTALDRQFVVLYYKIHLLSSNANQKIILGFIIMITYLNNIMIMNSLSDN